MNDSLPRTSTGDGCGQFALIGLLVVWFFIPLFVAPLLLPASSWLAPLVAGLVQIVIYLPVAWLARKSLVGGAALGLGLAAISSMLWGICTRLGLTGDATGRTGVAWLLALVALVIGGALYAFWRGTSLLAALREVGLLRGVNGRLLLFALAVAAPFVAPWAVLGALGDPWQMLFSLLEIAGSVLGSGLIVWGFAHSAYLETARSRWPAVAWAALVAGLLALGSGVWQPASGELVAGLDPATATAVGLVVATLSASATVLVGLLLATTQQGTGRYLPATLLVAWLYALGRPIFTDPRYLEQEAVFLLLQSILPIAAGAAGVVLLLARNGLRAERERAPNSRLLRPGLTALVLWLVVGGLYFGLGSPGIYADGLVVVLKEQADLSGASAIADRAERGRFVYGQLTATANRTQAYLRGELDRRGVRYRPYYIINMLKVEGNTGLREELAARPEVERVELNPNVRPYRYRLPLQNLNRSDQTGITDSLVRIGVPEAWALGVKGEGVLLAGADTGYDWTHPALKRAYAGWDGATANHDYHWHDSWGDSAVPWDDDSHGTHTMGTMVGDDGAGNQTGLAPAARWIGCRNMRHGIGSPTSYAECLEYFLAPYPHGGDPLRDGDPARAPVVVNNSWGCPQIEGCWPDALRLAVDHLHAAGVMLVVSAGNDGPACSTVDAAPSFYDEAYVVGATNEVGDATSFSSRGPATADGSGRLKPDIAAPGQDIRSSIPGGGYALSDGTSMAGPHVAGLVALIVSAQPALAGNIEGIEQIIDETAHPRDIGDNDCTPGAGTQQPNNVYGYGEIDALAAVRMALGR